MVLHLKGVDQWDKRQNKVKKKKRKSTKTFKNRVAPQKKRMRSLYMVILIE